MRYVAVLLVALSGACKVVDLSGLGGHAPHIELTSAAVSPTTVRAGSQFAVSASATYGDCAPMLVASYANGTQVVSWPGSQLQGSLTAVLGQTAVSFDATCAAGGYALARDSRSVPIQVTLAP